MLGSKPVDSALGGGLKRAALHEFGAASFCDGPAALGTVLGLSHRAAAGRPVLLIRQRFLDGELGHIHAPGLLELGLDPGQFVLFRARGPHEALRAASDAVRCTALGAAVMIVAARVEKDWLTISRRFSLLAEETGVTAFILHHDASAISSAATTRWQIQTAPSLALGANAPGHFRCVAHLLRHRAGLAQRSWILEWNRDRQIFAHADANSGHGLGERAAIPRRVVSVSAGRPHPAREAPEKRRAS